MKSMTGYGRDEARDSNSGVAFRVEITSVNKKALEIRAVLPRELAAHEIPLKRLVEKVVRRGSVNVRVDAALSAAALKSTLKINNSLVSHVVRKCAQLESKLEMTPGGVTLGEVLQLPGIVESRPPQLDMEDLTPVLDQAASRALDMLDQARLDEGGRLAASMRNRLTKLETLVDEIAPVAATLPQVHKERLMRKLEEARLPVDSADESLLKEVALFADRIDVSEEIERLGVHFKQFRSVMGKKNAAIGRNLEFLTQEMLREIGTLGVKAANVEISPKVVEFKTELEKIREQLRNIE